MLPFPKNQKLQRSPVGFPAAPHAFDLSSPNTLTRNSYQIEHSLNV
jgi:hypothetical protein